MPGAIAQPFGGRFVRGGFVRGGFVRGGFARGGLVRDGFRDRLANGFPPGPMLGPIGFGFPPLGGPFFGVPNGFVPTPFFGFPHRRFGLFFFDGFTFAGFGFFGGCPFATGFCFDGFPFVRGFPHRRFGFVGPHPFPFGAAPFGFAPWPWGGFWGGSAIPYAPPVSAATTVSAQATTRPPDTWPALGRQLAAPGLAPGAGDSLVVERVSVMDVVPATVLRLTWRSSGLEAAQVSLFLADSAQAVLASQTLRAPPFTALLDPPAGTAYAGVTAVWPDGTSSSRLVPYRVRPR
jgi:hypothetical protein